MDDNVYTKPSVHVVGKTSSLLKGFGLELPDGMNKFNSDQGATDDTPDTPKQPSDAPSESPDRPGES